MEQKTIGQLIKHLRQEKHLTQKQLSDLTGISQQYLSKIESDKVSIRLDTFLRITKQLNYDTKIEF